MGLAADVGTLQRLPKLTGNESFVKDICYTARKVYSQEALQMGLVRYFIYKTSSGRQFRITLHP